MGPMRIYCLKFLKVQLGFVHPYVFVFFLTDLSCLLRLFKGYLSNCKAGVGDADVNAAVAALSDAASSERDGTASEAASSSSGSVSALSSSWDCSIFCLSTQCRGRHPVQDLLGVVCKEGGCRCVNGVG
jgi:hypothetical protein